jgi:hypothetical protein
MKRIQLSNGVIEGAGAGFIHLAARSLIKGRLRAELIHNRLLQPNASAKSRK